MARALPTFAVVYARPSTQAAQGALEGIVTAVTTKVDGWGRGVTIEVTIEATTLDEAAPIWDAVTPGNMIRVENVSGISEVASPSVVWRKRAEAAEAQLRSVTLAHDTLKETLGTFVQGLVEEGVVTRDDLDRDLWPWD